MGIFDWMLKGFGFESKNNKKGKKIETPSEQKYANFNLHQKVGGENAARFSSNVADSININMERNFIIHEPKSHKDVQLIVDYIRQNQTALINLANIDSADVGRILDFLSGAIYALNGSIYRIQDDQFIITPDGSKILKPDEKKDK